MVERLDVYLNKMEIPRRIREKKFQIFSEIRQWANFVKHPKALMFVHHPTFVIDGFKSDTCNWLDPDPSNYDIIIDSTFVRKYYSNKDNDKSLYDQLTNQDKVIVVYPKLSEIVEKLCEAQKYFVELINENKVYRELLDESSTKYYESQVKQEEATINELKE